MDWLNACHIDTPVVSPMGPQRHNGIGSAGLCATQLLSVSVCPRLLIRLLVDITVLMILCDSVKQNLRLKTESLVAGKVQSGLIGKVCVLNSNIIHMHFICLFFARDG